MRRLDNASIVWSFFVTQTMINALSSAWGIQSEFTKKRQRCHKRFHDELSMDCRLADATQAFKVNVFYKILDVAIGQLEWRFEGQQLAAGLFGFHLP